MKMNYLKKFGAVALAAVMAVTFAPVASLNVFAAKITDKENFSDGDDIEGDGTYKLSTNCTTSGIVVSGGASNVTIDLNGYNAKVVLTADSLKSKTHVVIKDSGRKNTGVAGDVQFGQLTGIDNVTSAASVEVQGNLILANGLLNKKDARDVAIIGDQPVAKIGSDTDYCVGNKLINIKADGENIEVYNGAVEITELSKGHKATVAKSAARGTTVTAKTADKVALTTVNTTYTYYYTKDTVKRANNKGADDLGNFRDGANTYSENAYYAGTAFSSTTLKSLNTLTVAAETNGSIKLDDGEAAVYSVPSYERKISVNLNNEKWGDDDKLSSMPVDTFTTLDPTVRGMINGITYFDADPTSFLTDKVGVALLDGTKYVISTSAKVDDEGNELATVATQYAEKSVEVLRATQYTSSAKNKKAKDAFTVAPSVTVKAPEDTSIIENGYTMVSGINTSAAKYVQILGYDDKVSANNNYKNGKQAWENPGKGSSKSINSLNVPQVASGATVTITGVGSLVNVTKADGIGYYRVSNAKTYDYTFGATKDVTETFKAAVGPTKIGGLSIDATSDSNEVYASKEIATKVSGVEKALTIEGEINADVVATAADGTRTWEVNLGYTSEVVPAYRMYRKTGEHVYTINPAEVSMLEAAGWINEGTAFYVNPVVTKKGTPVYRVYNKNNGGMHFYTASAAEKDMLLANGWTEGAVVFYGADKATGIPVYRTYNTGSNNGEHNYTTNIAESDMNVKAGWRAEGVAFYVFK